MKTTEKQKQAEYLLLHSILEKYLESCRDGSTVQTPARYLELENISEIVVPFTKLKRLIQRIEWLKSEEYIGTLCQTLLKYQMTAEELLWAVEMFAVNKQKVWNQILSDIERNSAHE